MDGPWMAAIYPSQRLAAADNEWLAALKLIFNTMKLQEL